MSGISLSIELQDNFTSVMMNVINAVNMSVSAMEQMHSTMSRPIDTTAIQGIRDQLAQTTIAAQELNASMRDIEASLVGRNPISPALPAPVKVPIVWQSDGLEVFTGSGIERFRQEVQGIDTMLQQLSSTQDAIARQAYNTYIFPPEAFQNLNTMAVRMDMIRERIQQIENNPINIGTDAASAELEQMRLQFNAMIQVQNELNAAIQDMDVSTANDAYLRLSQLVSGTERYIRDNVDGQGQFNRGIQEGTRQTDNLMNKIMGMAAEYMSLESLKNVLSISDGLVQTTFRLDMINDGEQSTQELVNMVYAAAQDARGSFDGMVDVVAQFGNNARDAFSSSEEMVAFANLVQKQMTIAGVSTTEASNAMSQLSQALGSGVLRSDELNSIFEQAPNLIQNIADYLDVPTGQVREMAAEGELSADVVKSAIFSAADEINAKFDAMPMTWGQVWQSMENTALIAFQPVLQRLNDIANSESFQVLVNGAIEALQLLAGIALDIFDGMAMVGKFVADNWSWLSPIIYGVAGALAVYYGWQLLCAVATGAMAVKQTVLNAVMSTNPIILIIIAIIALIALIFAVCNAIAETTDAANSGFGVITGGVNVVNQFFYNLLFTVLDVALGIRNAVMALGHNIMTAFHNALSSVRAWWYDLLSDALYVIENICVALNKLPFLDFDYSFVTSVADDFSAKAAEAAGSKEDYESISDAFNEGFGTFKTFQDGWVADAFNAGASWGDGIVDKISNFNLVDKLGFDNIPSPEDYTGELAAEGIGSGIEDIAGNTGAMADAMDITGEELKYLRDIAEQESINRFTTAEVSINQTNHNTIKNGMDLDGIMSGMTDMVNEAIDISTEGVHE